MEPNMHFCSRRWVVWESLHGKFPASCSPVWGILHDDVVIQSDRHQTPCPCINHWPRKTLLLLVPFTKITFKVLTFRLCKVHTFRHLSPCREALMEIILWKFCQYCSHVPLNAFRCFKSIPFQGDLVSGTWKKRHSLWKSYVTGMLPKPTYHLFYWISLIRLKFHIWNAICKIWLFF